jgi:uncharacterized membrane protein YqjE
MSQDTSTQSESTADLVKQLSAQTSLLVRQELELAKAELSEKGKNAGIGAGLFGGAAGVGFYGLGALIATAIAALSLAVATWLAALIVTVVLFAIAAVLGLTGKSKVQAATPPAPEATIETSKQDVATVKQRAANGRAH